MPTIHTEIEIAASPEHVRDIFLDFKNMPQWSKSWFQSLEPSSPSGSLEKGEKIKIALPSANFEGVITENTPARFAWLGSMPYIFSGEHSFKFEPSQSTPGSTRLVQSEVFTGLLSIMMSKTVGMGAKTEAGFEAFNRDLKAKAESSS